MSALHELDVVGVGIGERGESGHASVGDLRVGWLNPEMSEPIDLGIEIVDTKGDYRCCRSGRAIALVQSEPRFAVDDHVLPSAVPGARLDADCRVPGERTI